MNMNINIKFYIFLPYPYLFKACTYNEYNRMLHKTTLSLFV